MCESNFDALMRRWADNRVKATQIDYLGFSRRSVLSVVMEYGEPIRGTNRATDADPKIYAVIEKAYQALKEMQGNLAAIVWSYYGPASTYKTQEATRLNISVETYSNRLAVSQDYILMEIQLAGEEISEFTDY